MLLAIRHLRKDLVHYSARAGKITARSVLTIMAITPIGFLFGLMFYSTSFIEIDIIAFLLWGISSIIDIVAAIIYKPPEKKQQKTIF